MSITSALVLFACIWALIFYMILPLWQTSQAEAGEIVPGTPPGAPVDAMLGKKAMITTAIAAVLFALAYCTIEFGWITLEMVAWIEPPPRG